MSMELWKELIELDEQIVTTNPGLYGRMIRGLSRTESQKLQEEIGWFLPNEIIDLYSWKNGTCVDDEEEACAHWELMPGKVFIPLQIMLSNLVKKRAVDYMKRLYVECGYIQPDEEMRFAPLLVTTDWQYDYAFDYVLFAPLTRQPKETLPLVDYDCGADGGVPYLRYDSLLSMVQVINQQHRAQIVQLAPNGNLHVEQEDFEKNDEIYARLNPRSHAITIGEGHTYFGESRWFNDELSSEKCRVSTNTAPPTMETSIEAQLKRLEENLLHYNPVALSHLNPGLTSQEIEQIEHTHKVRLEPDLWALYSWRNGVETVFTDTHSGANHGGEFFPHYAFLDLETAILQGRQVHPHAYDTPKIVDAKFLQNIICPFASVGSFPYEIVRFYLPFSTQGLVNYDLPIYREGNASIHDFGMQFMYDSLTQIFDCINFMYESQALEIGPVSKSNDWQDWRPIKAVNWEFIETYRRKHNPYCAEINRAVYGSDWPDSPMDGLDL